MYTPLDRQVMTSSNTCHDVGRHAVGKWWRYSAANCVGDGERPCVVEPELFCPPDYVEQLRAALLRCSERRSHGIVPDVEGGSSHADMNGPLGQHMRFILWEEAEVFEPWLTNPALLGIVYCKPSSA